MEQPMTRDDLFRFPEEPSRIERPATVAGSDCD